MSDDTDKIIIPIEIDTQGLKDLSAINQQIDQIDKKARGVTPSTPKSIQSRVSRSPIQQDYSAGEQYGIYGGERGGDVLPQKFRDRTSRQAIPSNDVFREMQSKIKAMEAQQAESFSVLAALSTELGYNLPFISSGLSLAKRAATPLKKLKAVSSAPLSGMSTATSTKGLKGYARMNGVLRNLGKYIPIAGAFIALFDFVANELPEIIKEELYGPGKLLDPRFKRKIANEIASATLRQEKQLIAQGMRTVITTSYKTARGATNVSNTLTKVIRGENLYNYRDEFVLRGGRP